MSDGGDRLANHVPGAASDPGGLDAFPPEADALGLFSAEAVAPPAAPATVHGQASAPPVDHVATPDHAQTPAVLIARDEAIRPAPSIAEPAIAQAPAGRPQAGVPAIGTPHGALAVHAAAPPRGARTRKRPVLVSALVALAVWSLGSLASLWLEGNQPIGDRAGASMTDASSPAPSTAAAAGRPLASPAGPASHDTAAAPASAAGRNPLTAAPEPARALPPRAEAVVRPPAAHVAAATPAARTSSLVAAPGPARPPRALTAPDDDAASARPEFSEDAAAAARPDLPAAAPVPTPAAPATAADEAPAVVARVEPPPVDRLAADQEAIDRVLRSYRTSYNALDATSVSTIWQGLDTRALQRAFATLTRQDVSFDRCDVRVTGGDRAEARCRGLLTYVPKIGDGSPQQRRLAWNFEFQRTADRWLIANVSAR